MHYEENVMKIFFWVYIRVRCCSGRSLSNAFPKVAIIHHILHHFPQLSVKRRGDITFHSLWAWRRATDCQTCPKGNQMHTLTVTIDGRHRAEFIGHVKGVFTTQNKLFLHPLSLPPPPPPYGIEAFQVSSGQGRIFLSIIYAWSDQIIDVCLLAAPWGVFVLRGFTRCYKLILHGVRLPKVR